MKRPATLAFALAASAAVPGAAAAETTRYDVVQAKGVVRVTFSADSATCASFGTCGDSGKVVYRFGGRPGKGGLVLRENSRGRAKGAARFRTTGRTKASVSSADGLTCTDTVRHRRERFKLRSTAKSGRLVFRLHPRRGRDYLRTGCLTPTERHLARARAVPRGAFRADDFDSARTSFRLRGDSPFTDRGYSGTVSWKLSYGIVRRG